MENAVVFVINSSVWWLLAVTLVKVMLAVIRNGSVNRLTEEQGVHFCTKKDLHVTGSQLLAALLLWSFGHLFPSKSLIFRFLKQQLSKASGLRTLFIPLKYTKDPCKLLFLGNCYLNLPLEIKYLKMY